MIKTQKLHKNKYGNIVISRPSADTCKYRGLRRMAHSLYDSRDDALHYLQYLCRTRDKDDPDIKICREYYMTWVEIISTLESQIMGDPDIDVPDKYKYPDGAYDDYYGKVVVKNAKDKYSDLYWYQGAAYTKDRLYYTLQQRDDDGNYIYE